MTACQKQLIVVSSATENDQLVGKRNASRTPLTPLTPTSFNIDVTNWEVCAQDRPPVAQYDSYRGKNCRNTQDRGGSEKARCSQSETLLYHQRLSRPDMPRVWKSATDQNWTKHDIIIEEVTVIIGNDGTMPV